MSEGLGALAQGVIQNNLIFMQGLGLYALTRWTKSLDTAVRAGAAVLAALFTAAVALWMIESFIFESFSLNIPFVIVVALLSAMFWEKLLTNVWRPATEGTLAASLLNSVLVGSLLLMESWGAQGPATAGLGFAAGVGFALGLVVMAGIRQRLELSPVPKALRGVPILLISAGLVGMALMGFRF